MDDPTAEDEKKPFDALGAQNDDDLQPDPDEHIMLESGHGRVWLVKVFPLSHNHTSLLHSSPWSPQIPKFLMERWSKFDAEGVQLGKIRIYDVPPGAAPRIIVLVPSEDGGDDDIYELDMVNQDVHNQVVVAERAKAPSGTGRARTTIMTGKVKHECNLRPRMTGRYERRLAERGAAANERGVRVGLMDGARAGRGGGKMLSSGITSAAGFADLAVSRGVSALFLHCHAYSLLIRPSIDRLVMLVAFDVFLVTAYKSQAAKRAIRAHGAHAPKSAARCPLCALPRARTVADQAVAGEDAAAGGVPEGGAVRNRESTSQWRVQRYLGAHAKLQGRWGTSIDIRHDG